MEGTKPKKKEDTKVDGENKKDLETLAPREQSNTIVGFLKKLSWRGLAAMTTYLLGYFNFSVAWMITPLILSALREQYKKEKRQKLAAAREAALNNEQAMIESRMLLDDLPSWVYFPDKERAEWVNNIIKQLWPNVNMYVRKMLFNTVEPLVKNILKGYSLKGFKFERENVFLGQIPPRITGIKVYNEKVTSRSEIIMDLDIVFASDLMVMFSLKGIKAQVKEFSLRGVLRVVLKPLISDIPLIGGVQVYFLSDPEIDYSLGGVAGALNIPGLSTIVERIIREQVRNFVVLPNKFTMPLVNTIPKKDLFCPNTAGVLRVTLLRAKDLEKKDVALIGKGSSDPYAILTVGAKTYQTPTKNNTCDPIWNLTYDFPIEVVHGQEFMLEFFDEDDRRDDEFLGRTTVQTGAVSERGSIEGFWIDLEECDTGKAQVSLSWLPVTSDPKVVRGNAKQAGDSEHAQCILHVYIDSCTGLDNIKNPSYKPCPMVQVVCNKESRQTWIKSYTTNPVIEQGFVMLVYSPNSDDIDFKVVDSAKNNQEIGTVSVDIWKILEQPSMEFSLQPWTLKGSSSDAKIVMSVSVRGIVPDPVFESPQKKVLDPLLVETPSRGKSKSESPALMAEMDETVKEGSIRLNVHQAVDLEKMDMGGKSDPYCVISYEEQESKTKVLKKTLSPSWDHEETIRVKEGGDNHIYITVMDKDKFGKDECMGVASLDVRRVSHAGTISQVWEVLSQCKSGKLQISATFLPSRTSRSSVVEKPVPEVPENYGCVPPPQGGEDPSPGDYGPPLDAELAALEEERKAQDSPEDWSCVPPPPEGEVVDSEQDYGPPLDAELAALEEAERRRGDGPDLHPGFIQENIVVLPLEPKQGFLHVTVHRAMELMNKDISGKSDPYVRLQYNDHIAKSEVVKGDLNPVFDFQEVFVYVPGGPTTLNLTIKDKDLGRDEMLGSLELDLNPVLVGDDIREHWMVLEHVNRGKVQVSVTFSESQPNLSSVIDARRPSENNIIAAAIGPAIGLVDPSANTGPGEGLRKRAVDWGNGRIRLTLFYDERKEELKVFVHEAAGLPGGDLPDPPDPYVKVYLMPGKKKKKKTDVVKDSGNPRFDEEFDFDVDYRKLQEHSLKVSVVDKKRMFAKSPILGSVEISLDHPGLSEGVADWYPLHHDDGDSD